MKQTLSVIGLGKLGLCTATCLAKAGFPVIGMDIRSDYVDLLRSGKIPFYEPGLEELLAQTRERLIFTDSMEESLLNSSASFIIVPTPSQKDGSFSNEYLVKVLEEIGPLLARKETFHVVNIVSTVMPGSCKQVFIPLLEKSSGKTAGIDFGVAYNPEFIAIGSVIDNFLNPDLVLIGATDSKTSDTLQEIYTETCANSPYIAQTGLINAEITKLSINCYCTMKISFANNLSAVCDNIAGTDAGDICEILGHDTRIGPKYIKPGLGFGGPCFPRDNEAFVHFIKTAEGFSGLQEAVVEINNSQPERFAKKIAMTAEKFGPQIALLGLTYKPNTYLTERSQALGIASYLAEHHPDLDLRVYDPLAIEHGPWRQMKTMEECVTGANVAAILTPWPEFTSARWHPLLDKSSLVLDFWA